MTTAALKIETPRIEPGSPLPASPPRWTKPRVLLALAALWVFSGVYLVAPDQQTVETLFGKFVAHESCPACITRCPGPLKASRN